jgi:hypothetical protein
MAMVIKPGDPLLARNAFDEWVEAVATSAPEGTHRDGKKIHDFPVVWVRFTAKGGSLPWPVEDVKPANIMFVRGMRHAARLVEVSPP